MILLPTVLVVALPTGCQVGEEQFVGKKFSEAVAGLYNNHRMPFYHGAASGDP